MGQTLPRKFSVFLTVLAFVLTLQVLSLDGEATSPTSPPPQAVALFHEQVVCVVRLVEGRLTQCTMLLAEEQEGQGREGKRRLLAKLATTMRVTWVDWEAIMSLVTACQRLGLQEVQVTRNQRQVPEYRNIEGR